MKQSYIGKLLWLFFINMFISAFTFGGGYVVIPMIRKYFVSRKQLFTDEEALDMAAVAQSSPGAIAVNLASLAGYRTAGFTGAVVSCVASVLPALILLSAISAWYGAFAESTAIAAVLRGMEAGVAAVIVSLVLDMYHAVRKEKNRFLTALVPAVFLGNYVFHINVAVLLCACCLICIPGMKIAERKDKKS